MLVKTIMLDPAELLNKLMTNSGNVLRAEAPIQGSEPLIPTHSAACLEIINSNTSNILLRLCHLMHLPLQEGIYPSWIAPVLAHNTQHLNLNLLNHSLPRRLRPINRLQMYLIHQAHPARPSSGLLNHLYSTAIIPPMTDNILSRHIQRTLQGSSSITKITGEHLSLLPHRLQRVASIHLLTRATIVLLITHMLLDLKALLQPLFHH
jgi:hypothetical protein